MGLILRGLAKIPVCPAHDDIVACEPGHDSDSILPAAPDGDLHSQPDDRPLSVAGHCRSLAFDAVAYTAESKFDNR